MYGCTTFLCRILTLCVFRIILGIFNSLGFSPPRSVDGFQKTITRRNVGGGGGRRETSLRYYLSLHAINTGIRSVEMSLRAHKLIFASHVYLRVATVSSAMSITDALSHLMIISYILVIAIVTQGWYCEEKSETSYSESSKALGLCPHFFSEGV